MNFNNPMGDRDKPLSLQDETIEGKSGSIHEETKHTNSYVS